MYISRGLCGFCIATLSFFAAPVAYASAFYIPMQSASSLGSGLAGAASEVRDSSIIYYNPAGMVHLDGAEAYFSTDFIYTSLDIKDEGSTLFGGPVGGPGSQSLGSLTVTSSAFFATQTFNDDLWVGLGVTTPFGLSTEYDLDAFNRFDSTEASLLTVDIQPTIAYRVTDWLSIGGGINVQYAESDLSQAVSDGVEGVTTLEGKDWSAGYNVGFMVKPTEKTTIGAHYRSKMHHNLDGRLRVEGTLASDENTKGSAKLVLPETVFVGVSHELNDKWTLLAEVDWFGWDSFSDIEVIRENGTVASRTQQGYQPTWAFAAGAQYEWNEDVTVTAGYHFDQTPTVSEFRTTQVPDGDKQTFAAGVMYDFSDKIRLDFTGSYSIIADEKVNVPRNLNLAQVRADKDNAEVGVVSVALRYKF